MITLYNIQPVCIHTSDTSCQGWTPSAGSSFPNSLFTQDKTRQDKTRQDKTRQDKTRQDKTRQDKTRQDKTRQDKTRQDKTRQDKTSHIYPQLVTYMRLVTRLRCLQVSSPGPSSRATPKYHRTNCSATYCHCYSLTVNRQVALRK